MDSITHSESVLGLLELIEKNAALTKGTIEQEVLRRGFTKATDMRPNVACYQTIEPYGTTAIVITKTSWESLCDVWIATSLAIEQQLSDGALSLLSERMPQLSFVTATEVDLSRTRVHGSAKLSPKMAYKTGAKDIERTVREIIRINLGTSSIQSIQRHYVWGLTE